MTDSEILTLMQKDDPHGLRELIRSCGGSVRYIVSALLCSPADCEEAVSDTFYKVWKNRHSIDLDRRSLKGYVCMTAKSCAIDKLRSLKMQETVDIEENDIGVEVDYADETAKKINMRVIADCIREMKSPDREIFIERYYFRLAVKDIADKHGVKPKKVENILFRGKKRLKEALIKGGIIL